MSDLISRQAAIDEINKYILSFDAIDANFLDGLRTAIKLIKENLPTAQQWIPCSERLPKEEVQLLVTDDAGGLATIDVDCCYFDEEYGRFD